MSHERTLPTETCVVESRPELGAEAPHGFWEVGGHPHLSYNQEPGTDSRRNAEGAGGADTQSLSNPESLQPDTG
jgi:hypothetical protein